MSVDWIGLLVGAVSEGTIVVKMFRLAPRTRLRIVRAALVKQVAMSRERGPRHLPRRVRCGDASQF